MKYKAIRTNGFASKLEASVYQLLELRVKAGEFVSIKKQPRVDLVSGIKWAVDFACEKKDGAIIYVEAKGYETETYRLKKKLWSDFGPGPLEVWKGNARKPFLHEIVSGKL